MMCFRFLQDKDREIGEQLCLKDFDSTYHPFASKVL
jgi:hypothetical protein